MVCVDTYRVLDSCRDKDCFEDVRVYLTGCGQEIISRSCTVRAKSAKVVWSSIDIDGVPFNRGFYQLRIRMYVKLVFEGCIGPSNIQEFDGIAAVDKKVILFGGEGSVSVFKSELSGLGCCSDGTTVAANTLPVAVFEVVDPIVLDTRVVDLQCGCRVNCFCGPEEFPGHVLAHLSSPIADGGCPNILLASLGFFSVVRIERPAQYLLNAVEYSVPEKECAAPVMEDACSLFRQMAFPVAEFSPSGSQPQPPAGGGDCGCRTV